MNKEVIAIIGAMDEEIESIKPQMEDIKEQIISGFSFFTGKVAGKDVVLLQSGIGKVNAAISTTILMQHFSPSYVINTGSAGGANDNLNVGDVVISDKVCYHDVDVTAFDYALGQVPKMPEVFEADKDLVELAQGLECFKKLNTVTGLIASGDVFMNCPNKVKQANENFPTMQACEMEAAAIAQTCFRHETPFIIFRSLSDIAGKESEISFPEYVKQAGVNSANMAIELISKLK